MTYMRKLLAGFCIIIAMIFCMGMAMPAPYPMPGNTPEPYVKRTPKPLVESDSVEMSVQIGYNRNYILGNQTPVFVKIKNNGADFDGNISLIDFISTDTKNGLEYSIPASIAAGAEKEFKLYFKPTTMQRSYIISLKKGEKVVAQAKASALIPGSPMKKYLGVLGENADALSYWGYIPVIEGQEIGARILLDETTFPQEQEVLQNFAVIILHHYDISLLEERQQQVLKAWINSGGKLIVDADAANAQGIASLSSVIQLEPNGEKDDPSALIDLRTQTNYNFSTTQLKMGLIKEVGTPIVTVGMGQKTPLIQSFGVGKGKVFVSAIDLTSELYREMGGYLIWKIAPEFKEGKSEDSQYYDQPMMNQNIEEALTNIEWFEPPNVTAVVIMAIVFILVAGVISFLVLKKLDKQELILITVPIFALIFTGALLLIGNKIRGNGAVTSIVSVFQPDQSRCKTYVGVGIPANGDFNFSTSESQIPQPIISYQNYQYIDAMSLQLENDELDVYATINIGQTPSIIYRDAKKWGIKSFAVVPKNIDSKIECKVYFEGKVLHYEVTNHNEFDLEDVRVTSQIGQAHIPVLTAGETQKGELKESMMYGSPMVAYMYNPWELSELWYSAYDQTTMKERELTDKQKREFYTKRNVIIESLPTLQGVQVLAWSKDIGKVDVQVNGKTARNEQNLALLICNADLVFEDKGKFSLPTGFIKQEVTSQSGSLYFSPDGNSISINAGTLELAYKIPSEQKIHPIEMQFQAGHVSGSYKMFAYNNRTFKWDEITMDSGLSTQAKASGNFITDYLNNNNEIRLQITVAQTNQMVDSTYFDQLGITFEGEVK